jgi:hypothetical protein
LARLPIHKINKVKLINEKKIYGKKWKNLIMTKIKMIKIIMEN